MLVLFLCMKEIHSLAFGKNVQLWQNCTIFVCEFSTGATHVNFRNNYFDDSPRNNDQNTNIKE